MKDKVNKYLLNQDIKQLIKELKLKKNRSVSFFTVAKLCKEVKYCKQETKHQKCVKNGIFNLAKIKKNPVSKKAYTKAKKERIGNKIKKDYYELKNKDGKVALHIHRGKLKGLSTLTHDNYSNQPLEQFLPYIVNNITNDERYTEHNLVFYGDPKKCNYNIYSVFKDIELGRVKDINSLLFKEMTTVDGVRIVLFQLFNNLKNSHKDVINSEGERGLKEFDENLKSTTIILKSFKDVFEHDIVEKVLKHLKVLNISIKKEKNLRYINKQLLKISSLIDKDELEELKSNLNYKLMIEKKKIKNFFGTREFSIILRQYELLLKEGNKSFFTRSAKKPISMNIEKILSYANKENLQLFDKYSECEDNIGYKQIVKSLKKLNIILDIFDATISLENKPKLIKSVDTILSRLHANKDVKRKRLVADTYLSNIKIKPKEYNKIKKSLKKDSKKYINKNREIYRKEILNLQNRETPLI